MTQWACEIASRVERRRLTCPDAGWRDHVAMAHAQQGAAVDILDDERLVRRLVPVRWVAWGLFEVRDLRVERLLSLTV